MTVPERTTFFRFVLLYMGMFFALFASLSFVYYQKESHTQNDQIAHRMTHLLLQAISDPQYRLPDGFTLSRLPVGDALPWELIQKEGHLLLMGDPVGRKGIVPVLSADRTILDDALRDLKRRILLFMMLAFFVNLAIAWVLGWFSLRPLRRANQKLKEFTQDILHDLNAPVTAMGINLEGLSSEYSLAKLKRVQSSARQIQSLYHNLEAYLREDYRSQAQTIDLGEMTQTMLASLSGLYPDADFRVEISPMTIRINPHVFERMVINLVQNAVKYGGRHPVITLGTDRQDRFFVRDNGPGMETVPDLLKRRKQRDIRSEGYGLGLDIVRKLSAQCHIPIRIDSVTGEGTTIYFDLHRRIIPPK